MPLEDDFSDILKKARIGQGLSVNDIARATGLSGEVVTTLEQGGQPRSRADIQMLAGEILAYLPTPTSQRAIAAMALSDTNSKEIRVAAFNSLAVFLMKFFSCNSTASA